jgi:hypothetical protein
VVLERGPLSLVNTTEELLERNSSGSGLESREYAGRDPSRWPRVTFYPQKLSLTLPTSGGRSVGIVRSRTQVTEFSFVQFHTQLVVLGQWITTSHGLCVHTGYYKYRINAHGHPCVKWNSNPQRQCLSDRRQFIT